MAQSGIDKLRADKRVEIVDDERSDGGNIVVTMQPGWTIDPMDHHAGVFGADTLTEAWATLRSAVQFQVSQNRLISEKQPERVDYDLADDRDRAEGRNAHLVVDHADADSDAVRVEGRSLDGRRLSAEHGLADALDADARTALGLTDAHYSALFNAIADSVKLEWGGTAIAISVRSFRNSLVFQLAEKSA